MKPGGGDPIPCPRGCGLVTRPAPMAKHVKSCLMPFSLERVYEIGGVDTSASGCWEWQALQGGTCDWYPRIGQKKVMQLVCELAYGEKPDNKARPLHSCDNMRCVRFDHLRWGSQGENLQDARSRGRMGGKFRYRRYGDD